MRVQHCTQLVALILVLAACGGQRDAQAPLPTAHIPRSNATPELIVRVAAVLPTPTTLPTPLPASSNTPAPPTPPALPPPLDQYRAWMEEAHARYPYSESIDTMWAVMLCESSGDANAVADPYYGLFQYDSATWMGDWNPYRDLPILDPRAQIFATAKAWQDGNQHWWGCY